MEEAIREKIQSYMKDMKAIPALPDVYFKVKKAFENPSISVEYIANAIRLDQSLTLSILRLANSPFFGFRNKISSISQAVMLIGLREIYSLVLSISVMGVFPAEDDEGEQLFPLRAFWEHSLAVAVTARFLAKRIRHPKPEELFVAGLIHDIGKIVEKMYLEEEFIGICRKVKSEQRIFREVEEEVLGFHHAHVGSILAENWNFPPMLCQITECHHSPDTIEDPELLDAVAVVHVADALVKAMGLGWSGDPYVPQVNLESIARLKIDIENDLPSITFKIQNEFDSAIQSLLG